MTEEVANRPHRLDRWDKWGVGVVALVATIVGSIVGAYGANIAATKNASAQHDVARENFDREKRVTIYENFASAATEFYSAVDLGTLPSERLLKPGQTKAARLLKISQEVLTDFKALDSANIKVQIGGSDPVRNDASDAFRAASDLEFEAILTFTSLSADGDPLSANVDKIEQDLTAFSEMTHLLIEKMRKELY